MTGWADLIHVPNWHELIILYWISVVTQMHFDDFIPNDFYVDVVRFYLIKTFGQHKCMRDSGPTIKVNQVLCSIKSLKCVPLLPYSVSSSIVYGHMWAMKHLGPKTIQRYSSIPHVKFDTGTYATAL